MSQSHTHNSIFVRTQKQTSSLIMAAQRPQALFTRLRRAIQKVQFLLSFNARRWISSSILGSSSPMNRPRLSFKSQPSGLLDFFTDDDEYCDARSAFTLSRTTSTATDVSRMNSPAPDITRSTSDASSSADDINQRADDFIANFYKHIQMERQVSLELRYCCREGDLERTRSEWSMELLSFGIWSLKVWYTRD